MKRPEKIYGRNPTAEEFNQLIDYVHSLEIAVGGTLEMKRTSAGTFITSAPITTVDVVTNVKYNIATGKLTKDMKSIYVSGSTIKGVDMIITTAVECP